MKKHYATKLKEENAKLLSDIEKIVNGNTELQIQYKVQFDLCRKLEETIWYGNIFVKTKNPNNS